MLVLHIHGNKSDHLGLGKPIPLSNLSRANWGTTENAVHIQIFATITTYCLVAIVAQDLKTGRQSYEMLQILGISLLDKNSYK